MSPRSGLYRPPYTPKFSNWLDCANHLLTLCPQLEGAIDRFVETQAGNRDTSSMDVRALAHDFRSSLGRDKDYATSLGIVDSIRSELKHSRPRFNPDLEYAIRISFQIRNVLGQVTRRQWLQQHFLAWPHARLSRRTRFATDLAVRMLAPIDRQRYRQEWAAELADLPRRDQAPCALRLLSRAWSLRRELSEKPRRNPRTGLVIVGVVVPSADAVAALCGLDWPAAVVGLGWMLGLMWVVSSKDRTQRLIDLIREARSSKAPTRK
jgi:hypothetical protein